MRHECDEKTGKFYRNFTDKYISSWMDLCKASLEMLDSEKNCPNVHPWKESISTLILIAVAMTGVIFLIIAIVLVIWVISAADKFFLKLHV